MRILQVIPELDTGGAERTTLDIVEAVVADGGQAHVWSEGGRLESELAALGGVLHRAPAGTKNPWSMLVSQVAAMRQLVRSSGIDLIHARSRAAAWTALCAARAERIPFATTYHGIYNGKSGLKRWYNGVMARGDVVIANSRFTADHLIATHGTDPARVRVIPRGVDLDRFSRAAVTATRIEALRSAWFAGAQPAGPVIMLPGRLTAWKGQSVAIEALAVLRDRGHDATLLLVGDDQGRSAYAAGLIQQAAADGLSEHVILTGHCADMPAALCLADIVICPSTEPEAFGRTAAEAGAMGLPVVAAAHGGATEVIEHAVSGLLVAPGDAGALAAGLSRLLEMEPAARKSMGAAASARVRDRFSKKALQAATLDVYAGLLKTR